MLAKTIGGFVMEKQTVSALFDDRSQAENAVQALTTAGFSGSDMSVTMRDRQQTAELAGDTGTKAGEAAGAGAVTGTVLGALGGLLIGAGLLAIPGIGPVLAAGQIASVVGSTAAIAGATAAGAGIGAAAGGLIGALVGLGIPEDEAHVYVEGVRRGGTLVLLHLPDARQRAEAEEILRANGAVNTLNRRAEYERGGWTRFDEAANDAQYGAIPSATSANALDAASTLPSTLDARAGSGAIPTPISIDTARTGAHGSDTGIGAIPDVVVNPATPWSGAATTSPGPGVSRDADADLAHGSSMSSPAKNLSTPLSESDSRFDVTGSNLGGSHQVLGASETRLYSPNGAPVGSGLSANDSASSVSPRAGLAGSDAGGETAYDRSSKVGTATGTVAGAATGAALGAVAGPVGAIIGGVVGAVTGGGVGAAGDAGGERAAESRDNLDTGVARDNDSTSTDPDKTRYSQFLNGDPIPLDSRDTGSRAGPDNRPGGANDGQLSAGVAGVAAGPVFGSVLGPLGTLAGGAAGTAAGAETGGHAADREADERRADELDAAKLEEDRHL